MTADSVSVKRCGPCVHTDDGALTRGRKAGR